MSADMSVAVRAQEENWLPILELAVQEVFEIMLGCRLEPAAGSERKAASEVTAMVGLAGALCGILTMGCGARSANLIAARMLGTDVASSGEQVCDALGEICNMIAGNFESGSAQMKASSQPAFDRIAILLRDRKYRLRIEGHTDNVPIHNLQYSSNWELSTARATEIVRLLMVRDGFDAASLSAAGYAEYHPIASNGTPEGRGMNRRVDIVILGHGSTGLGMTAAAAAQAKTPGGPSAAGQKPSGNIPQPALSVYSTSSR
jgi:hypothetical protein